MGRSSASDAGGVTANAAGLHPPSPGGDFFFGPLRTIMAVHAGRVVPKLQCKFVIKTEVHSPSLEHACTFPGPLLFPPGCYLGLSLS